MVKIQKCKRHGVCNDCGKQQSDNMVIWEIKASTTGQGWTTIMLCKGIWMNLQRKSQIGGQGNGCIGQHTRKRNYPIRQGS